MYDKNIFVKNLNDLVDHSHRSRAEICKDLDINYYSFSDWLTGRRFPRMDKIEKLSNYFGVTKSELLELKAEKPKSEELCSIYSKLSLEGKDALIKYAIFLLSQEEA